jgi:hypothetical protein
MPEIRRISKMPLPAESPLKTKTGLNLRRNSAIVFSVGADARHEELFDYPPVATFLPAGRPGSLP